MSKKREWNPDIRVTKVVPKDNYILYIEFSDGTKAEFSLNHLVGRGVFSKLEDETFYKKARPAFGTVVWDDNLDIAPETLYERSMVL